MGCVNSKQVKSPSKGTSWGRVVDRRLTIQVDRSIKTSYGGYLGAIFSANYDIVANPTPVKALEKAESLPIVSGKGSISQYKVRVAPEIRRNKHVSEKPLGDTVLGVPIVSVDQESRVPIAQKPRKESANENSETINVMELMEGLAEAEASGNIDQWQANHDVLMSLTQAVERHDKRTDDPQTQRRSGKMAARRSRSRSFSSFKSTADVECALLARRSGWLSPIKSSRKAQPASEQGEVFSRESSLPPYALSRRSTSLREANVRIDSLTMATHFDGKAFRNQDNLWRALSFKYMLNDNGSDKLDCLISELNPAAFRIDEANATFVCSEHVVVATSGLCAEGEGTCARPSPDFSPAISLKDWLPSTNYPSNCLYLEDSLECSVFDLVEPFQPCTSAPPHHSNDSLRARTMHLQVDASPSPSLQDLEDFNLMYTRVEETVHTSTIAEEDYAAPIFDPEMLNSFEQAMQILSKEEWDALRGMEDSPRHFLRLVKVLKKSSSNSMQNLKANASECAEPLDIKLKKLSVEKKLAFMRQNSLEVKKAFAKQLSLRQGRANVVFYSLTTQANPKMYADCNQVRKILQSLVGVSYDERSISELPEHKQELSCALNISAAIVPTIFVKGKYLVGIDSIIQLYLKGLLDSMLQEAVSFGSKKTSMHCTCRGSNFSSCPFCKGRRKLSRVGEGTVLCRYCSGTGFVNCLSCSLT